MNIELKIKAKHLALEPGIIRKEERKLKKQIKYLRAKGEDTYPLSLQLNSLSAHRRKDVRYEARATHLARTFLDNKPYAHAEQKRKAEKEMVFQTRIIPRILAMVKKYGGSQHMAIDEKAIRTWVTLEPIVTKILCIA